jgi:hypothetical protein
MSRLNPFTARPNADRESRGTDGHVVKPAGKNTFQMPGVRRSIHCFEANWALQSMGERDMREAEDHRRAGQSRQDSAAPSGARRPRGERP